MGQGIRKSEFRYYRRRCHPDPSFHARQCIGQIEIEIKKQDKGIYSENGISLNSDIITKK
jgi:hypothetical protein